MRRSYDEDEIIHRDGWKVDGDQEADDEQGWQVMMMMIKLPCRARGGVRCAARVAESDAVERTGYGRHGSRHGSWHGGRHASRHAVGTSVSTPVGTSRAYSNRE